MTYTPAYRNRRTISRWIVQICTSIGLLCLTLTQVGAAYMCVTPPVTEAYIRNMDNQIKTINDLLKNAQCVNSSKVTLFGLDFYPDPPDEEGNRENLAGDIFTSGMAYLAQTAAVSANEGLGLKEFFLSFANTQDSYQLQLDVKQAQQRLDSIKKLMAMSQQACASSVVLEVNGEDVSLAQYVETLYYAYRQLYYWLLLGNNPSIPAAAQEVPRSLLGGARTVNTVYSLYNQLAQVRLTDENKGKWYPETLTCSFTPKGATRAGETQLPGNIFDCNIFYTQEYANSLIGQCQSPELNTAGLDAAVKNLETALLEVGQSAEEIGEATEGVVMEVGSDIQAIGGLVTRGDISPFVDMRVNVSKSMTTLGANFVEWLSGSESSSAAQRIVEKNSDLLNEKNQPVQGGGIASSSEGESLGQVLGATFANEAEINKARLAATAAVAREVGDTFIIREQTFQNFLEINQLYLPKAHTNVLDAANALQLLCKKHQPRPYEECGEITNSPR